MPARPRPVLLCYDGSPNSREAIELAGEIVGGGPALVLYAWLPPSALLLLGRVVGGARPLGPAVAEFDAAVVVGSHGHSPTASAVLESVSHGVVNHCNRPVLVSP